MRVGASARLPLSGWLLAALMFSAAAQAAPGVVVEIDGLDDERLRHNVEAFLDIESAVGKPLPTDARVHWLHAQATAEIHAALEPFGYYSPQIDAELQRSDDGGWRAVYRIDAGQPVRVRDFDVVISGAAAQDAPFAALLDRQALHAGAVFEHSAWEDLKSALQGLATERGYFEARIERAEVIVDPDAGAADVHFHLDSGRRYRFGELSFRQDFLKDSLLRRYNRIKPGDPYDAAALIDLQSALNDADYFSTVELDAGPDRADGDVVPIDVRLEPRKRKRYDFGLGYGTDTGPRGRIGYQDRWVNPLGHKINSDLRVSTIKSTLSAEYVIPGNDPRTEQVAIRAGADYENSSTKWSQTAVIGISKQVQLTSAWQRIVALDEQVERFRQDNGDTETVALLIPSLSFTRLHADDKLNVKRGDRLTFKLRGAAEPLLSDLSFAQFSAGAKRVQPLGDDARLLVRLDAGTTWTSDLERLPTSIRFYAGGDNSVRGYAYESIGPRNAKGDVIGGKNTVVGSIEYEHRVVGDWSVASFVDAGDAFNDSMSLKIGAGIGLRWASPIGPIRLDLAHGFDDPGDAFRIHFTLGPDL